MRFYTVETIGPKRAKTPEGYLICYATPIARAGLQTYGPDETPIEAGPDGIVKIERDPDQVFRPETMASAEGKPLVNDHPDEDVGPGNYKQLTCGTVLNVRRGEGVEDDLALADVIVMDAAAIADVDAGKAQLSCGYDCDYDEIGPGHARQTNIIINHIALVQTARCGPRCSLQDHAKRVKVHDSDCCGACASAVADAVLVRRRRPVHLHIHT